MKASNKKKTFISFVGNNDAVTGDKVGAILTALKADGYRKSFDEVVLIWTLSPKSEKSFLKIAEDVKEKILIDKLCKSVSLMQMDLMNVTDHNEIYPKLLQLLKSLNPIHDVTVCISSGTPAMQVCWILMAESGDYKMKLIRSNEPQFKLPAVTEIKLDTGLPRIQKAQTELKKLTRMFLDEVVINTSRKTVTIGGKSIDLTAMHFVYYFYFMQRAKKEDGELNISGYTIPGEFVESIKKLLREFFPDADSLTFDIEKNGVSPENFRSHISKIKKTVEKHLGDKDITPYYAIVNTGRREMASYGVTLNPENIKIVK